MSTHIRFDWAMKRLLRQKANFVILEGFLSELLMEKILIQELLESESNQEEIDDKFNRIDILVKNNKEELMLIEVQNEREYDFFHRMNYGQAKLLTEHINIGMNYEQIKKIYSINIVYFDLGQGEDYVYKGKTEFRGLHNNDILQLSQKQKDLYNIQNVSDIYTTYYLLKVNKFNDIAKNTLDEWIYFLKNSEIKEEFSAQGLAEAKRKLLFDNLNKSQKLRYNKFVESWRIISGSIESYKYDGFVEAREKYEPIIADKNRLLEEKDKKIKEVRKKAEQEKKKAQEEKKKAEQEKKKAEVKEKSLINTAKLLLSLGIDIKIISEKTGLSVEELRAL